MYREGIYLGYRYFDSFGVKPLYPFGFGLSYTTFSLRAAAVEKGDSGLRVRALVENTGSCPGKEVAQLYLSACGTQQEHPFQELKAFAKTRQLAPSEGETLTLDVPWRELASYVEEAGAWVIQAGTYLVRLGNSSAATQVVGTIQVQEDIVVSQGKGSLAMDAQAREKVDWLTRQPAPVPELPADCVVLSLAAGEVEARPVPAVPVVDCSALSDEELACLCVGFGPGLPFPDLQETELPSTLAGEDGRPLTENDHPTGHNGYVSPAIPGKGIHSVFYKDGPAGIGQTGWPGEILLACSFDRDVLRAMGDAIGRECEVGKVDVWLAPALSLIHI